MGHSVKSLRRNMGAWWARLSPFWFKFLYWGAVPSLFVIGMFSKPYSPMLIMMCQEVFGVKIGEMPQMGGPGGPGAPF